MYEKKRFSVKKILFSQIFIIIGLIVLCLILVALSKEVLRSYKINKDLEDLKNEITSLEAENSKFTDLIEYLKSQDFAEKEARKRMNLKKSGESVVVIETNDQVKIIESSTEEKKSLLAMNNESQKQDSLTNPEKWWAYFFGKNN